MVQSIVIALRTDAQILKVKFVCVYIL